MDKIEHSFFWMNGLKLDIDTLELFSYVRAAPEPIPIELINWSSLTSSLSASSTQWSSLLVVCLYNLMEHLYGNHELVIRVPRYSNGESVSTLDGIPIFEKHMSELWTIVETAELSSLSVWATSPDDYADALRQFEMTSEPWFSSVLELPHIKLPILESQRQIGRLKSKVRHLQAEYNRYAKEIKKLRFKALNRSVSVILPSTCESSRTPRHSETC